MDDQPPDHGRDEPGRDQRSRDELDAREAARVRRRDRDASAAARDLMRPGMGKVFKQILDSQASAAREPTPRRKRPKR